jgi:preprotein translocase subunit SecG
MLMFFIYLLTVVLVLDCVILVLLVLVQLPKKEAGMGQAFGGAATDALFGAGSGNVLTKMTKWGAGIFFALAIALTVLGTYKTTSGTGRLPALMGKTKPTTSLPTAGTPAPAPGPSNILNLNLTNTATNAASATTNAAAK